jgi:hypothetical protein
MMHDRSGGPLLAATSGSCKCCNPSVFALRLTQRSSLVTDKFTRIRQFHSSPTSEHKLSFDSMLADAGNPLVRQLGGCLCRPWDDWSHPRVTKDWCSASQSRLPPPPKKKAVKSTQRVVSHYSATRTEVFVFLLSWKANAKVEFKRYTARLPSRGGLQPKWFLPRSQRPSTKAIPPLTTSTRRHPSKQSSFPKG